MKLHYDFDNAFSVHIGRGVELELTLDRGRVFFHGFGIEGKHNAGLGGDQAIRGVPLPECEFTEWVLDEARDLTRKPDPTWFISAEGKAAP